MIIFSYDFNLAWKSTQMVAGIFMGLGAAAIVAGGLLMALSARRPTRLKAWAGAYLVLVVGVVQFGLAAAWSRLGKPDAALTVAAFLVYNLGNLGVIYGTAMKTRSKHYFAMVKFGGLLLAAAMVLLLAAVRHARDSWMLVGFIALTVIIFVSMPVGIVLSGRSRKQPMT